MHNAFKQREYNSNNISYYGLYRVILFSITYLSREQKLRQEGETSRIK